MKKEGGKKYYRPLSTYANTISNPGYLPASRSSAPSFSSVFTVISTFKSS